MSERQRKKPVALTLQQREEIFKPLLPCDAQQALKTLQCFAANNPFGVAAIDALMKLEICMTDAKIDGIYRAENALPE